MEKNNTKPRFNFNPQRQQRGFKPQSMFKPKTPTPFQGRQPQPTQPKQPIPTPPTNELQDELLVLQQEVEELKQSVTDSNGQAKEVLRQIEKIKEYLNQEKA